MSASKIGSSTIFKADCTIRSRTAGIDNGRNSAFVARLRDQHPTRRQRPIPALPQLGGHLVQQPESPRTPGRRPGWPGQCPAHHRYGAPRPTRATGRLCGRPCPTAHETVVRDRPWPSGTAHVARHEPGQRRTSRSGGTSRRSALTGHLH